MSSGLDLEQRYRRALRLLPGYYREQWEEDMVAAFLDGWLTGDPEADEYISRMARPDWAEVASVAGLAARLYLGGVGTPRRYFAWGQAIRRAVLALLLLHAVLSLDAFVLLGWSRHVLGGLPGPPASLGTISPGGPWPTVWYAVTCAWLAAFLLLVRGRYRIAQVIAALAVAAKLAVLLNAQLAEHLPVPYGDWAAWALLGLLLVLGMTAFHADAPPPGRRPWLLALPGGYLLVFVPILAVQAAGNAGWLPDLAGLCCILVALACLAHLPRAWSRRAAGPGAWSLALALLAVVAGVFRIVSLADYRPDPHLIKVGLAELLILAVAVALVAPDAVRTQAAAQAPPLYPGPDDEAGPVRTRDSGWRASPHLPSVLTGALAAALMLAAAGYAAQMAPLGPGPPPAPARLRTSIASRPCGPSHPVRQAGARPVACQTRVPG